MGIIFNISMVAYPYCKPLFVSYHLYVLIFIGGSQLPHDVMFQWMYEEGSR